ncbi:MAG: hypothetical protein WC530_00655 [Candidatus Omnitrophota bacterium]|jgi:hypothetical protein
MNFRFLRFVAGVVLFAFMVTSMDPVTCASASIPQGIGMQAELPVSPFEMFEVPAEFGQITDMITGNPSAPAFIHIQSAHGSYEAEKNIEKLLGYIEKNSSVRLMLLEGAANKLQPELFRIFSDHPDFNRKVTDKLMQEGYLTGPENFLINQGSYGVRSAEYDEKAFNAVRRTQNTVLTEAFGIEDLEAYKKDRNAFIAVVKKEKTAERLLGSLRAAIDKRFAAKVNKEFLNLVRQEEAFGVGTVSFEGWLKILGEASKRHLKIDLSDAFYQGQYPFLIRYFRLQVIGSRIDREKARQEIKSFLKELAQRKISEEILGNFKTILQLPEIDLLKNVGRTTDGYSILRRAFDLAFERLPKDFSMTPWPNWTLYAQYIILMQEMEGKGLHEEAARLKDKIQTALAKTADEKEYLVVARKLCLLRRLFSLELTRAEYEELKTQRDSQIGTRTSQGTKTSLESLVPNPEAKGLFVAAMTFYQTAIVREQHMFANALARMEKQKQNRAVIVTGGFHADGLKKLAASKSCSYLQITPRINEVSKRDHEIYLRSIFGFFDSAQAKVRDLETSQMNKVPGLDRPAMQHVLGEKGAEAVARAELRIIRDMINSEDVSIRPALIASASIFLAARAEMRQKKSDEQVQGDAFSLLRPNLREIFIEMNKFNKEKYQLLKKQHRVQKEIYEQQTSGADDPREKEKLKKAADFSYQLSNLAAAFINVFEQITKLYQAAEEIIGIEPAEKLEKEKMKSINAIAGNIAKLLQTKVDYERQEKELLKQKQDLWNNKPGSAIHTTAQKIQTPVAEKGTTERPEFRQPEVDRQKKQAVFSDQSSVSSSGSPALAKDHGWIASFKVVITSMIIAAVMGFSSVFTRALEPSYFISTDGALFSNVEMVENFSTLPGLTGQNFDLSQIAKDAVWMYAPSNHDFAIGARQEGSEIVFMVAYLKTGTSEIVIIEIDRIPDTWSLQNVADISPDGTTLFWGVKDADGVYITHILNTSGQAFEFRDVMLRSLSFKGAVATAAFQINGVLRTLTFNFHSFEVFSNTPEGGMITPSNPDFAIGAVLVPGNRDVASVVLFQISTGWFYEFGQIPSSWSLQGISDLYISGEIAAAVLGIRDENGVNTTYVINAFGSLSFNGFIRSINFSGQTAVIIARQDNGFTKTVTVDLKTLQIRSTIFDVPPGWKAAPSNPDGFAIGKVTVGSEEMLVALDRTTGELIKIATIPEGSSAQSFSDILSDGTIVIYGIGDTIYVQKLRDASSRVTFSGNVQYVELNGQTLAVRALHNNAFWKTVTVNLNSLQIISTLFDVPSGWIAAPSNPNGFAIGEMASGSQKTLTALARDTGELIPIAVIPSGSSAQSFSDISSDGTLVVYGIGNNGYVQKLRTSSSRAVFIGNIQSDSFSDQTAAVRVLHYNKYPKTVTVNQNTMQITSEIFDNIRDELMVKSLKYFVVGTGIDTQWHFPYDNLSASGYVKAYYTQPTLIGFYLRILGNVALGKTANGMTQAEVFAEINTVLTNLRYCQTTFGWKGLIPWLNLGSTMTPRTSEIGIGDNLNLSKSLGVLIGTLESAGDLGAEGVTAIANAKAFLAAQEEGYKASVDPANGLFYGTYNKTTGSFSTYYHLDRVANEFFEATVFAVAQFGVPDTVCLNQMLVTANYTTQDGQTIETLAPWDGSGHQVLLSISEKSNTRKAFTSSASGYQGGRWSISENRYPGFQTAHYNFMVIQTLYASQYRLPGAPSAGSTADGDYEGKMGIPQIAERTIRSGPLDNEINGNNGLTYAWIAGMNVAPEVTEVVSEWLGSINSQIPGINGTLGFYDSARSKTKINKWYYGIDVASSAMEDDSANFRAYLVNRGMTEKYDQIYEVFDETLRHITRTPIPFAHPPVFPDYSLSVFDDETSEGRVGSDFPNPQSKPSGVKFQGTTTAPGGHYWKFSSYDARANRLSISYSTGTLPVGLRVELKKNGVVVYSGPAIPAGNGMNFKYAEINLPNDPALNGVDEAALVADSAGTFNFAIHLINFQHFPSVSLAKEALKPGVVKKGVAKLASDLQSTVAQPVPTFQPAPPQQSSISEKFWPTPSNAVASRAELRTAVEITNRILSIVFSGSPAYAAETEPQLFPKTLPAALAVPKTLSKWPAFNKIISRLATASTERMVIDQRQGIPDAASVLPLITLALYNSKVSVVQALIADTQDVAAFVKKIAALSPNGKLPQNFKVQGFANENEFIVEFAEFYNSSVPSGRSVALVTDRADSMVTHKIGVRKKLLSVLGDTDSLKQTASALLAADKLLDESVWSMGYHFVAAGKLGGFDVLMIELAGYLAAQKAMAAAA